ncbi:MAG: hypothetical protein ACLP3K_08935 [Candidatus Acidiferrales bacterium]
MSAEPVALVLGRSEALVLFEKLADFYSQESLPISDDAERLALVRLHGALEKVLVEPFSPNYKDLIRRARADLIAQHGKTS